MSVTPTSKAIGFQSFSLLRLLPDRSKVTLLGFEDSAGAVNQLDGVVGPAGVRRDLCLLAVVGYEGRGERAEVIGIVVEGSVRTGGDDKNEIKHFCSSLNLVGVKVACDGAVHGVVLECPELSGECRPLGCRLVSLNETGRDVYIAGA